MSIFDSRTGRRLRLFATAAWLTLFVTTAAVAAPTFLETHTGKNEFVITNATILTVTHGRIEKGSVYVKDGKIVAFGASVPAPAGATVIDAGGKYVTPGIIDSHSHMALGDDVNEATSPVVPHMQMKDAFEYDDKAIYRRWLAA